jgi:hypothetical protein
LLLQLVSFLYFDFLRLVVAVGANRQLLLGAAAVPGAGGAGRRPLLERLRVLEGQCARRTAIQRQTRRRVKKTASEVMSLKIADKFAKQAKYFAMASLKVAELTRGILDDFGGNFFIKKREKQFNFILFWI